MILRLGALYFDLALTDTDATRPQVINSVPGATDVGVVRDAAIELTVVDPGAAGLNTSSTTVTVTVGSGTPVVAWNGTAFDAGYPAPFSSVVNTMSPGSTVTDTQRIRLVRTAAWPSLATVTVSVFARTAAEAGLPSGISRTVTYSFTIEDYTNPTVLSARTRGLRTVRVVFSEPIDLARATAFRDVSGRVGFTAPSTVSARGAAFSSFDVGRALHVAGAQDARNDGGWRIATVIDPETVTISGTLVTESSSSTTRAVVSPYLLAGVLDPALLVPVFTPLPTAVRQLVAADVLNAAPELPTSLVEIDFSQSLSPGRSYTLSAGAVEDLFANPVDTTATTFVSETRWIPDARRRLLVVPQANLDADASSDLRRFRACLDEALEDLFEPIDRFGELFDNDLMPDGAVRAALWDLGSPFSFTFDLTPREQRRLLWALPGLYRQAGTGVGVETALGVIFAGNTFAVRPLASVGGWLLGDSILGVLGDTTILAIDPAFGLYSFEVHRTMPLLAAAPGLTTVQRQRLTETVERMRPAHTHFVRYVED